MLKQTINSDKLLSFFSGIPITPNQITLLAVLLSVLAFVIFPYNPLFSIILFAISFFVDALDGVVARAKNLVSKKGAFLDGISDRIVEFFLLLTIIYYPVNNAFTLPTVLILFFGTCMTAYVKAYSHHQGLLNEEQSKNLGGLLERAERVILLFISLLSLIYFPQYLIYLLWLIAILSILTFSQRLFSCLIE